MMILTKPHTKLLEIAQNIFGKDLVTEAYACTTLYDDENLTDEYVQQRIKHIGIDIDLHNTEAIHCDEDFIMLVFANGKEVLFDCTEHMNIFTTAGYSIKYLEGS